MRTAEEMLTLIMTIAEQDERIRAVMMNGSRVNPAAKRDIFQDFDIVYFVTEIDSFLADHTWVNGFGERMIMQMPEAMADPPPMNDGHFGYLMQFTDGNRIDLTLFSLALLPTFTLESLSQMLLDKDGLFPALPPPMPLPIVAMSSGGSPPMSPRACGATSCPMPKLCWMARCATNCSNYSTGISEFRQISNRVRANSAKRYSANSNRRCGQWSSKAMPIRTTQIIGMRC